MALSITRRFIPVLVISLVFTLLIVSPAVANDEGKKDGLAFMQLKKYDLGIFTLIVFGLLVLILQRFAWPKISEGLAKREATIQGARDEALAARREAEELRTKLQKDYADAHDKIRAMLDEARVEADKLRTAERDARAKEAAADRERVNREIEAAKDIAINDLYRQAVDLATNLSARTLSRQISVDDHRRLLDESLAELKQVARIA